MSDLQGSAVDKLRGDGWEVIGNNVVPDENGVAVLVGVMLDKDGRHRLVGRGGQIDDVHPATG